MRTRTELVNDNRGVVIINEDNCFFWAYLCVNVRNGFHEAEACNKEWTGKTFKGAERWAKKQLGIK